MRIILEKISSLRPSYHLMVTDLQKLKGKLNKQIKKIKSQYKAKIINNLIINYNILVKNGKAQRKILLIKNVL